MSERLAYIGIRPECGCVTFWMALDSYLEQGDVTALQSVLDSGRTLEVCENEEAKRRLVTHCPHVGIPVER